MPRSWVPLLFSLLSCGAALAQCVGDQPIATTIPAVRGQGSPSACAGKTVVVNGVVTASLGGLNGFFLQDPAGDGDPTTSDAIFVLTNSAANLPDPGSVVQITGKVIEQQRDAQTGSVTELDITAGSVQLMGAAPLPAAVILDPDLNQQTMQPNAYFQALEGMLVQYPASTVVTPNDDTGVYYALRNDRLPDGQRVTDSSPGTGLPILIDTAGGGVVDTVNEFDTVPDLVGVLHFDNGAFRFHPLAPYDTQSAGITPQAATADQPYLSIASLDCQHLTPDLPADTFKTRLNKLAMAIRNELGSPDLIAVQGIGDSATIIKLSQAVGANYLGLILKGCNPGAGSVGLIFNTDTIFPAVDEQYEAEAPEFNKPKCTLPNGQVFTNPLFENPVLRVDLTVLDNGSEITLLLNDWQSQAPGADAQARAGVDLLQNILSRIRAENLIVLGDFNQPEGSDALTAIEQRFNLVNLSRSTDPSARYSVMRNGRSQALDHIFVSPALAKNVMSSGFAHYNADFSALPNRQDATTPLRVSDHDSPFLHLQPY